VIEDAPVPYRVVYSAAAREALRKLAARAKAAGRGEPFLAAVKEFDRILRLYPQFGEPLTDLTLEAGQVWRGTVPPLVLRYAVYEERRLVIVATPPLLLPGSSSPGQ
jgi:hypothetical protein